MNFAEPLPFAEAVAEMRAKTLLPTNLSSAELRDLDADLRNRSIFSARTTKIEPLQKVKDLLGDLLSGKTNMATARAALQDEHDRLEYDPESGGYPGDRGIKPAERGSLRDLSSDKRTTLVLETNLRQLTARGFQLQGQTDFALYAWPCYELIRIYPRRIPRGEEEERPTEGWPERWEKCGGSFYGGGRMIARKDDPIWAELGSSKNFPDALDTDVEPYAFGSGYGRREVSREDSIALGVIDAAADIQGRTSERAEAIEQAARFDPEFLRALRDGLDVEIADGKAKLQTRGKLPAAAAQLGPVLAHNSLAFNRGNFDEAKHPRDHGKFADAPGAPGEGRSKGDRKASYKPMSRERLHIGLEQEAIVAKAVGGKNLPDNEPFDVIAGRHALEVKTIIDGTTGRIIVNKASRIRKEKYAKKNRMKILTVAIDARKKPVTYYTREGVGAFSLTSMTPTKLADIKKLLHR
jgi:hypothetical protein